MSLVAVLLLLASGFTSVREMCHCYEIEIPGNYTALAGDLQVTVRGLVWEPGAQLELLQFFEPEPQPSLLSPPTTTTTTAKPSTTSRWGVLGSLTIPPSSPDAQIALAFPCGVVSRGGRYGVRLAGISDELNNVTRKGRVDAHLLDIDKNIVPLDVRWPDSLLSAAPRHIETYPTTQVTALLQFLPTACTPAAGAEPPETWLDLISCGPSPIGCADANRTHGQVVYSEQIRGYPRRRSVVLRCEFFGLAGHYALVLKPSLHSSTIIPTQNQDAFIKAAWSEQYIFNVRAPSIFPCDVHGGGVPVLFQYPQCILYGDKVRLYSRLRADVSALTAPTVSAYVTEQSVVKGKHSLFFDCDLFSERYVEYCFVYVSKAITGAVSDVRVDCVPTLPVSAGDSGGWGPWSEWTSCTTTCGGGTRNRFRICDSPPPRYGAKFCEGDAVQTERCGNSDWDCEFTAPEHLGNFPAERPDVRAEVGPGCRCGCIVHLGVAKPRRLLASSSHSCPGRMFWLIQADEDHVIHLSMEHFRFPCRSQWLKIRDGDGVDATLVSELNRIHNGSQPVISTGRHLLIEFFSDTILTAGPECGGGFLAYAEQTFRNRTITPATPSFSISSILRNVEVAPNVAGLSAVHSVVVLFLAALIIMTACLGVQYVHRYRKYQRAAAAEDQDSLTAGSQGSLLAVRSRATSNSTLLSEVISMRRFVPKKCRHSRLREVDAEAEEEDEDAAAESSDSQREEKEEDRAKSPVGSQGTLKAESSDGSMTPTPSPENFRRELASLKTVPDESGNCSSLDSTTSRGSSIARLLLMRRQAGSPASTRSSVTTQGCDSTSSSLRSNPKDKKDKRNRERLMAGSEFSLTGEADLEMDYYDYNVHNAAAVPESYIGMDPAYLIWIPPVSPVSWDGDEKSEPNDSELITNDKSDNRGETKALIHAPPVRGKDRKLMMNTNRDRVRMLGEEKETSVEKSPSGDSADYAIDDIKFADDDEDENRMENSIV